MVGRVLRYVFARVYFRWTLRKPLQLRSRRPRRKDPEIPYTGCFWSGRWWKGYVEGIPFAVHPVEFRRGGIRGQLFLGAFDYDWNTGFFRDGEGAPLVHDDGLTPRPPHPELECAAVHDAVPRLSPAVRHIAFGHRGIAVSKYGPASLETFRSDLDLLAGVVKALQSRTDPPLVAAVERGDVDRAQRLLGAGEDPNRVGPFQHTHRAFGRTGFKAPLHLAADAGNTAMVRALLDAGARLEDVPLALAFAIEHGHLDTARLLATRIARQMEFHRSLDCVLWLAPPPLDETNALDLASRKGNLEMVRMLLEAGASPSAAPRFRGIAYPNLDPWRSAAGPDRQAIREAITVARVGRSPEGGLSLATTSGAAGALSPPAADGALSLKR